MLYTHTQVFRPTIVAKLNSTNPDLIRTTITDNSAEASLTMNREAWQALIAAVEAEMLAEQDWTVIAECGD